MELEDVIACSHNVGTKLNWTFKKAKYIGMGFGKTSTISKEHCRKYKGDWLFGGYVWNGLDLLSRARWAQKLKDHLHRWTIPLFFCASLI